MPHRPYFVRRPCPQPVDFETYWQDVVTDPDGNARYPAQERDRKVEDLRDELAFINAMTPGRLLDVGCGLGHLLSAVDPRWERHGVELSGRAARMAAEFGIVHHGDLRSAGYPDGFFDVVTMYHVIEHMEDPVAEVREIRRVLKPGGWLLVSTPNFDSACARRFGPNFRMLHDKTHVSLFGSSSLLRMLEDLGFLVTREEYPFFGTRYFTRENLERLFDTSRVSPPFYGSVMTLYAQVPRRPAWIDAIGTAGRASWNVAAESAVEIEHARQAIDATARQGGTIFTTGSAGPRHAALLAASGRPATALRGKGLPCDASPIDLLLLPWENPSCAKLADAARQQGLALIVLAPENVPREQADTWIAIPAVDPAIVGLVQDTIIAAIGSTVVLGQTAVRPTNTSLAQGMNEVGARRHPLGLPTTPVCVTCQSTGLRSAARVGS
jgi:2-polyprenyl-3-methyl-5-hydroxy-6-metoxy-1,4-benzoquinol methylase